MMGGLKLAFSAITIILGAVGLMNLLPYDITMSAMFFFLGLAMLANAKEKYDKGNKQQAKFFGGLVAVIYAVLAYDVFTMIAGK